MAHSHKTSSLRDRLRGLNWVSNRYSAVIVVLSSIAVIWTQVFWHIHTDREQSRTSAFANASNLARALEQHMLRELGALDQTLLYVRDSYVRDPHNFKIEDLQRKGQFLSQIATQVAMADAKGILMSSNLTMSKPIDLSDREHIRVHLDGHGDHLFVSKPVKGRLSGKWVMQLTRRMEFPDGTLAGVVVASAELAPLMAFHSSVLLGAGGSITLVGDDGVVRLRSPDQERYLGLRLPSLAPSSMSTQQDVEQSFQYTSPFDKVEQFYWSRRIEGYPLRVVVGQSAKDVYRVANAEATEQITTGLIATLWLLGMLGLIIRYQHGLAQARDRAEVGTRAKSQFLTTMSHEIRTPLNGIIGLADVLSSTHLNAEQKQLLNTLHGSATHLLGLLNDVLDLSRLEADKMQIENTHFSVQDVAQNVVDMLRPNAAEKGLKLILETHPDLWAAHRGDPARIRQVLLNLLGNGIKFTQTGFVRLCLDVSRHEEGHQQQNLQITVEDSGCGIPAEALRHLFSEFSQVDASIARRHGGTGLGLAITQRLVRRMGGDITVRSEEGLGTCFKIELTLDKGDLAQVVSLHAPAEGLAQEKPNGAFRILLAEDNLTNRFVISRQLQLLGQDVDTVEGGSEAFEAVASKDYDLVFMDVMMPGMDGLEATRRIRAIEGPRGRVRILALSANISAEDQHTCLEAGMNGYVTKPVTREQLLQAINREMGTRLQEDVLPPDPQAYGDEKHDSTELPPRLAQLQHELGREDATMVVDLFLDECLKLLDAMKTALDDKDRMALKRLAHSIKGAAAGLGFDDIADQAKSLESHAFERDLTDISRQIEHMADQHLHMQNTIRDRMRAA